MSKRKIEGASSKVLYRDGLSNEEKVRYDEKLKILGGCDPYEIQSWSSDVSLLPPVTYIDIVNYLLWTPSVYTKDELKSYKGLEAYNQFVNGWVRDRASAKCGEYMVVTAKVLHSQRLREKPLKPWFISDQTGQVLGAHCTCMAGLGEACTHIAALLFAVDATVRIRDTKTVTDEKAYWLLPSAMKTVEYKKVREIDFTSAATSRKKFTATLDAVTTPTRAPGTPTAMRTPKTPGSNPREDKVPEASDEDMDLLYKKLWDSGSRAAILSIVEPYCDSFIPTAVTTDFPKVLSELREDICYGMNYMELIEHCESLNISCSKEQSEAVERATKDQTKSKLWNSFRAGRITASRMKSVCNTDPASPAQSLIKGICYPESVKFTTAATKWGCEHEKMARDEFLLAMSALHENARIEDVGFIISPDHPFIGASPDGVFLCDCCGKVPIEIKCPFCIKDENVNQCKYLESENGEIKLSRTHEYYFQVQTQIGCSGSEMGYFVVWTEKDLHIEQIAFDADLWTDMCASAKHVFVSAVLPELVGKFYSKIPTQFSRPPLTSMDNQSAQNSTENTNTKQKVNEYGDVVFCYCEQGEHGTIISCKQAFFNNT